MNLQQNTPEWLEFRKNKIGASDAPVIMGASPWKTPFKLWQEKTGVITPSAPTQYMQRGLELESFARLNLIMNYEIEAYPAVMISKENPWMMASLDGIDETKKIIIEIKCPGEEDHKKAKSGEIPDKYFPQVQHQMYVAEVDRLLYVSYDGEDLTSVWVERNDAYIGKMIKQEKSFYECMLTKTPPELCDRDYFVRQDEPWRNLAQKYRDVAARKKAIEKEEADLREAIIAMAQGQSTEGEGLRVARVVRKGSVDYDKIPELKNIDLEIYRKKPVETWRFVDVGGRI